MLTNTILSDKLHIPLTKFRRWTKEFLRPDPKARRRSGYTRGLTNNEGFIVFLGGHMVSDLGFSFADARRFIQYLMPWIQQNGLLPEIPANTRRTGIDRQVKLGYVLYFQLRYVPDMRWFCWVSGNVDRKEIQETDTMGKSYQRVKEETISYMLDWDKDSTLEYEEVKDQKQNTRVLYYSALLNIFNEVVLDKEYEWLKSWWKTAE